MSHVYLCENAQMSHHGIICPSYPIFIWRIFVPRLENGINLFITETHGGQGAAEMLEEFGIPFLPVANDNQKLGPHGLPPMTSLEQKHGRVAGLFGMGEMASVVVEPSE